MPQVQTNSEMNDLWAAFPIVQGSDATQPAAPVAQAGPAAADPWAAFVGINRSRGHRTGELRHAG